MKSAPLSPFTVDLSLQSAWDVEFDAEPLKVDLFADTDGHICIDSDISQPSFERVEEIREVIEEHRQRATKELDEVENKAAKLLEEHKQLLAQTRVRDAESGHLKRQRTSTQPTVSIDTPEQSRNEELESQSSVPKRVISLELDTEDEELLVSSEEDESDSLSGTALTLCNPEVFCFRIGACGEI